MSSFTHPRQSKAMSACGTELPTFALQRFRPESGDQLTLGGSDPEDRSWHISD